MKLKVALLQINSNYNSLGNFEKASFYIKNAKKEGADIVLLPELWSIGYSSPEEHPLGVEKWYKSAYQLGDDNFSQYRNLARDLGIAIALPYLEVSNQKYYNSVALIDTKGDIVVNYQKVHTVDKGWEVLFSQGSSFPVVELNTQKGLIKIGFMICFDREFPESARILMLNGAEIILVPNACILENNRLNQFQSRGFENMTGVAMTNYPKPKFNGKSVAFDGMREKGIDYNPLLILADETENIFYAEFDIDKLRKYRETEIWGDAYRRPDQYIKLT